MNQRTDFGALVFANRRIEPLAQFLAAQAAFSQCLQAAGSVAVHSGSSS
jgi:hypothetical protein